MKPSAGLMIVSLLVAALVGTMWFSAAGTSAGAGMEDKDKDKDKGGNKPLRARAVIYGAPGSGIMGEVIFSQQPCPGCPTPGLIAAATDPGFENFPEPPVNVVARIFGPPDALTPGAHGIHIHENAVGGCVPPYTSTGGHFDPGPFVSSLPVDANHPFHMGDLPNLIVDASGDGFLRHRTSRITLSPGPLSIFDANGSAVVVKLNPDRGINGVVGASGGPRVACGVIEMLSDAEAETYNSLDYDDGASATSGR